jgi:hypothetical protein
MEHHHDRTVHGKGLSILKWKSHILLVAVVLMIIALVILHVVFANSIYKAGGFSPKNPLSYMMIGGFLLLVAFKLKYLWRFKNSIGKHFKK